MSQDARGGRIFTALCRRGRRSCNLMANLKIPFTSGVPSREVMFFTTQLALLLETGSNLTESLGAIAQQTQNVHLKAAVRKVTADVNSGKMLSTSLGKHPRIFSPVYVSMIRAGEMGGFMAEMLQRMADFMKMHESLKSKVRSALAYPAVLTVISVGVAVFMVTFVMPRFMVVFEGKEHILPGTTKALMFIADIVTGYWALILIGLAGLVGGVIGFCKTPVGRKTLDSVTLWAPLCGAIFRAAHSARVLRTLGVMLESGIPLLDGVEVTKGSVGSGEFKQFLDKVTKSVKEGRSLAEPFAKSRLFPPAVKQMVTTSEMTGSCGPVMVRLADFYDEQVENRLRSLTAMLEPAIVVVMGAVVGFIALSLFMPLFKLSRGVF